MKSIQEDIKNNEKNQNISCKSVFENKSYTGENGIDYFLIQVKNDVALLKSGYEYVVANGIKLNEENKIFWHSGSYYNDLSNAVIKFNSLTLSEQELIQNIRSSFDEIRNASNFIFVASIIDYIQDDEKENVSSFDISKLRYIYDEYTASQNMHLLSDEIMDLEELLNINSIKRHIYDYLEENGVNINALSDKKVNEMAGDVLEEAINSDTAPEDLIYDDYLEETLNEYNEDEEEDEL